MLAYGRVDQSGKFPLLSWETSVDIGRVRTLCLFSDLLFLPWPLTRSRTNDHDRTAHYHAKQAVTQCGFAVFTISWHITRSNTNFDIRIRGNVAHREPVLHTVEWIELDIRMGDQLCDWCRNQNSWSTAISTAFQANVERSSKFCWLC